MNKLQLLTVMLFVTSVVPPFAPTCRAGFIYTESANGTPSHTQSAPTTLTVGAGDNTLTATVGGGSPTAQDWVTLTVPAGLNLSNIALVSYSSTDSQGFTGVQSNSSFQGSANSASSYLGYAHFGTGATNGEIPPTNLVGADLMPIFANPSLDPGAQGLTPPLGPGNYSFLIQQLGATTNYEFDYVTTPAAVPEPSPLLLLTHVWFWTSRTAENPRSFY